jgi:2-methylcitrate synthase
LNLHAEHEFNASTFAARDRCTFRHLFVTGATARCAALGGANGSPTMQNRLTPEEAEADVRQRVEAKQVIIGFGHPVYTIADPRNTIIKGVVRRLSESAGNTGAGIAEPGNRDGMPRRCFRTSTGSPR